ncbi:DNA-binding protein YbiB [Roseateles toxinivorans]|uniref:Anthranilate phosphoribosyltransferase n=1 Tax=Roseateles toxinivorans TaxID=270368 RepID=A0A4R6QKU2_9BURK|nr:DNA-binding protein YbiB [Roseateles toxinivorans]TDP63842.1 anthranilate phosphoribosyltransferase [Roseateles toxinivorans]
MQFAPLIKEIGRGSKGARDMDGPQAETLFGAILDGQVPDMELGAILLSLRIKGESAAEVAGFVRAMQARTAAVEVPDGPRCVLLPTFNGARKQANLMPLVALLLARAGVPVLIHGRHDFDSRESPFALLEALGIPLAGSTAEAAEHLAARRLACLPLAALNPGLDRLMALRPRLGVRNSGHSVAKLLDAAPGRSVRVVAVTHPEYLDSMGQALPGLTANGGRALLMRASEGEAYAHLRRPAHLIGFADGQASELHAAESANIDWPLSGAVEAAANAALITAMLDGREVVPPRIAEQVCALTGLADH